MDLKDQIKAAREANGWDIGTFADKMGVSNQAVKYWELGHGPKLSRVKDLEEVLNTTFNVSGQKVAEDLLKDVTEEDKSWLTVFKCLKKEYKDTLVELMLVLSKKSNPISDFVSRPSAVKNVSNISNPKKDFSPPSELDVKNKEKVREHGKTAIGNISKQ